jgi:acetyl-CoA C-acetyltransferase
VALDPRTPVVVGVGQVTAPPDGTEAHLRPQPYDLMARALAAAAEDTTGAAPGAASAPGRALLEDLDSLRLVAGLGWRAVNPGMLVAGRLGIEPAEHVLTGVGGNMPQALLHDAAGAVARGEVQAVAVAGAECMHTRGLARRHPEQPPLAWDAQPAGSTPPPRAFGVDRAPLTELEMARGILLPIHAYPLFENALRARRGWSRAEHTERLGRLWSGFSAVAAANPVAWIRRRYEPADITTVSPENRMVSVPYTKLCNANMDVDQAAAFLVCSVARARAAGVPEERWVFPLAGAEAHDHWFVSHRHDLGASPAMARAGAAVLGLAGVGPDDLAAVDLYSCFPCVVQMAAEALGLDPLDPDRPLTQTGGLTFAGGPGNNYGSHGLAATVGRLRAEPGAVGLSTGLGWFSTKHAMTVLASRPPDHRGAEGFRFADVQAEVDALPQTRVDTEATGPVEVETYTVPVDRDGTAERAIVALRTPAGDRAWGNVTDPDGLALLLNEEGLGRTGTLEADGRLRLD